MSTIPSKVIASCFALAAFAVCIISGLFSGNEMSLVVYRSIIVMFTCWFLGRGIGHIMQSTVEDYINRFKQDNPAPKVELLSDGSVDSEYAKMGEEYASEPEEPESQRLTNDDINIDELLNAA